MAISAGTLGRQSEWLDKLNSGADMRTMDLDEFMAAVVAKASTPNNRFAFSIFPRYLFEFRETYGKDFIDECRARYPTALVSLRRRDVLRQAVSFARARQTKQYAATLPARRDARYDFDLIAQCYFYICESNAFWDSYLGLRELEVDRYLYEDLLDDASGFILNLATRLDVDRPTNFGARTSVQRDALTEEWLERFQQDLKARSPLFAYDRRLPIKRSGRNLINLARRRLVGHHPFKY
ncbi:Stf0 family sulfotransferase [Neorhizobium galegae]|uniref:Stf0 family sulfotransferase n=1 Tax=Neorhizobium galegae TaxID=399 RepID=UPI00210562C0|nr:Stf0 family sulfotransferase [Neorhizobium galegae]MCQ1854093.1 Stf0 family sulfotransferase [Neorhizobium galegae]